MCRQIKNLCLFFLLTSSMSSCFSIKEEIEINENGTGRYSTNINLSKMMAMLQMFSTEMTDALGVEQQENFMVNKDTTFGLKNYTDTSTSLSSSDKKIIEKGILHLKSNTEEGIFEIAATVPFDRTNDMAGISISNGKKSLLDILFNASGTNKNNTGTTDDDTPPPFEMVYIPGHIERKFIPEVYERIKDKMGSDENDEQAKKMFEGNNFTTIIHFQKPIKKADGKFTVVSADKKTVTIDIPFLDFINKPKDIAYSIDY